MFPGYPIERHHQRGALAHLDRLGLSRLFDRHIPDWREDNFSLRYALGIPLEAIRQAHSEAKQRLIKEVNDRVGVEFDQDVFTLGFARRATAYKRPTLLFHDPDRLRRIAVRHGPLQVVFAGKAHPNDEEGKALIQEIFRWSRELQPDVKIAYLPNYDMELGLLPDGRRRTCG